MTEHNATRSMFDPALVRPAIVDSFKKLTPRTQFRNPVMFCVYVGSILTTILWIAALGGQAEAPAGFILAVTLWLWFTVLFANFAEALAEGRSKAQAASLRSAKKDVMAKKLNEPHPKSPIRILTASDLRKGDVVLVETGDVIPADGEVIDGVASVDESAITGESAPVIRESGGDFSSVTGGTRVLSDWIVVRVTANPGEAFLDRMIAMVEGAKRQKTPNEIALTILLVALTIVMLLATATLLPFSMFSVEAAKAGHVVTITALVALLVCLIPTTIGGLVVGDRRGRHEPHDAGERDRHVGPRGRSGRRRRRAVARQDRHHHARQSPGFAIRAGAGRRPKKRSRMPRNCRRSPTKRRKAAASSCWRSSASTSANAIWPRCMPRSSRSPRKRA